MARTWVAIGAVNGLIAVTLGAFGAHILKEHLDAAQLATYEVGVRYQMVHALSLLAIEPFVGQSSLQSMRSGE